MVLGGRAFSCNRGISIVALPSGALGKDVPGLTPEPRSRGDEVREFPGIPGNPGDPRRGHRGRGLGGDGAAPHGRGGEGVVIRGSWLLHVRSAVQEVDVDDGAQRDAPFKV